MSDWSPEPHELMYDHGETYPEDTMEPDGYLRVLLHRASGWDIYKFSEIRGIRQTEQALVILAEPDIWIPWHNIIEVQNYHNSAEYVEYMQDQPSEEWDIYKNCMECFARLNHHQIHLIATGRRTQELGINLA